MTRPRFDDSPPDPDSAAMEAIRQLEQLAPSAGTAAALLNVAAVRPQPIDRDSLKPTADPLPTLTAVEAHYRQNPADGCAVAAGPQLNESTVFALRGPVAGLRAWLADAGTEERADEHGRITRTYRPMSPYVTVAWSPPKVRARSVVAYGAAIDSAHRHLVGDRDRQAAADTVTGWLVWTTACVWTVAPQPGTAGERRQLVLTNRKLGHGVELVASGIIPWHCARPDGWVCAASGVPIAPDDELAPWLAEALGARWTDQGGPR